MFNPTTDHDRPRSAAVRTFIPGGLLGVQLVAEINVMVTGLLEPPEQPAVAGIARLGGKIRAFQREHDLTTCGVEQSEVFLRYGGRDPLAVRREGQA